MFVFHGAEVNDLAQATGREWLLTNGLGSYASSTLCGMSTRRYHGLLIAGEKPLLGRKLLVAKLGEVVAAGAARTELDCNRYPGVVHPSGHEHLVRVEAGGCVVTHVWAVPGGELTRRVAMLHGHDATAVVYSWEGREPAVLELRPLVACRDYHHTQVAHPQFRGELHVEGQTAWLQPYVGSPRIHFAWNPGAVQPWGAWYYSLLYDREAERGLDYTEDLYCPGVWTLPLEAEHAVGLTLSTSARDPEEAAQIVRDAGLREEALLGDSALGRTDDQRIRALVIAGDAFGATRENGQETIIAGYPWFTDWGRDTMIALPGLTSHRRAAGTAERIITGFAELMRRGLIPNCFPEAPGDAPAYNTVDGTLWMFVAAARLMERLPDPEPVIRELWRPITSCIAWHLRGTDYGIGIDAYDGLPTLSDPTYQLTWMDAKIGDWVVTPRTGKPIEIAALWYNVLLIGAQFAGVLGEKAEESDYRRRAAVVRESFDPSFWLEKEGYYADVLTETGREAALRPNQAIALSLPHEIAPRDRARRALGAIEAELLTPYGLRSLAPSSSLYQGIYRGGPFERDSAYHQGTVWSWLIGPYARAYLRAWGDAPEARAHVRALLEPLLDHTRDAGVGSLSEIFDGDAPHAPRGTIAQAWSVAEVLDLLTLLEPDSGA